MISGGWTAGEFHTILNTRVRFIVMKGSCVACIGGADGEIEVMHYGPAAYFGEIALLKGVPRKASVYATSPHTVCLMIDEPSFRRVLGPIRGIGRRVSVYFVVPHATNQWRRSLSAQRRVRCAGRFFISFHSQKWRVQCGVFGRSAGNMVGKLGDQVF